MRDNIITAVYNTKGRYNTNPVYQYDYVLILQITDVELPPTYEVHFSNSVHGKAITQIGDSNGVAVPDMLLLKGLTVYAWLFLHTGDSDGETEFLITIPVIQRAKPEDYELPQSEHDTVYDAIINWGRKTDNLDEMIMDHKLKSVYMGTDDEGLWDGDDSRYVLVMDVARVTRPTGAIYTRIYRWVKASALVGGST